MPGLNKVFKRGVQYSSVYIAILSSSTSGAGGDRRSGGGTSVCSREVQVHRHESSCHPWLVLWWIPVSHGPRSQAKHLQGEIYSCPSVVVVFIHLKIKIHVSFQFVSTVPQPHPCMLTKPALTSRWRLKCTLPEIELLNFVDLLK